ncbi:peptidoglycan-binding protein [Candidatus Gracilibacteria bacterium]|nr:peptidoglycan-binding protein [Candidatus Gracilibacteria bacterium]
MGDHVRNLQKTMKALGYFQEKETAIFGPKTKESVINYQLKNGIIKSKNDSDAGIIGEKTQKSLQNDLVKYLISNKDKVS